MRTIPGLPVVLWLAALLTAAAVWAEEPPAQYSFAATAKPLTEVAAELTTKLQMPVLVVGQCDATATVALEKSTSEQIMAAVADSATVSWLRAYLLLPAEAEMAYTGDQFYALLQDARDNWGESLMADQGALALARTRAGQPGGAAQPGGKLARPLFMPAPPDGNPQAAPNPGDLLKARVYDPVRMIYLSPRQDQIDLQVADAPLQQALNAFTTASNYLVAVAPEVTGTVTLDLKQVEVGEALARIAAAVGGRLVTCYLLSQPRQLTEAEMSQMEEQAIGRMSARFWSKAPEERAQLVQRGVDMINKWAASTRQPTPDGKPNRGREMLQTFGPRAMGRFVQYMAALTPDQRHELKPLMRALGQALQP